MLSLTQALILSLSACEPVGWVLCGLVLVGKRMGVDNCQPECEQVNFFLVNIDFMQAGTYCSVGKRLPWGFRTLVYVYLVLGLHTNSYFHY